MKYLILFLAIFGLIFSGLATHANEYEAFAVEEQFVIEMMAKDNYRDFVDSQITHMQKSFPKQLDGLTLLKARVMNARKQKTKAMELAKSISKTSPYYRDALLLQAEFHSVEKPKEAIKAYLSYIKSYKKNGREIQQIKLKATVNKCCELMHSVGQFKESIEICLYYAKTVGECIDLRALRFKQAMYLIRKNEK